MSFLKTPIEYLKGVGTQRAELLGKELQIFTFGDLLMHLPFRYVDRSKFYLVSEIQDTQVYVQIRGKIIKIDEAGVGKAKRLTAILRDQKGSDIELVWFQGIKWMKEWLKPGLDCVAFGKPGKFRETYNMVHPDLETAEKSMHSGGLQAVYPLTEKLKNRKIENRTLNQWMQHLLDHPSFHIPEILPERVIAENELIGRKEMFQQLHRPKDNVSCDKAVFRMKFEEFFLLQTRILSIKARRNQKLKGLVFGKVGPLFHEFYEKHLPFALTEAQKRVLREIRADMATGRQMNRLLQGDVGSGKTIVALLTALLAMDNGYQVSLMAPTEILAFQHYEGISALIRELPLEVALLTGSTSAGERKRIAAGLTDGSISMLIGTHALIEDAVQLKNQGLVIIDEQHRFGVQQRARLWQKSEIIPHVLVMTATPIPRTLAMTVYGDLDVSIIDELPGGRKPIKTIHRDASHREKVFDLMRKEITKGRQVYVVYPLIEESETLDYQDLSNGFDRIVEVFLRPHYQVDMLHGRMKPNEKDAVMERFKTGITNILVSTTVIEVGVNVPNATVMVIESAEKFGLAQLHQLRGRVGRGGEQSYCILLSSHKLSKQARQRLGAMVDTTNGFLIAEMDMKLRGPGDLEGTRQSGLEDLKMASIVLDGEILERARKAAQKLLDMDPGLQLPEHAALVQYFREKRQHKDWSRVS